MFDVVKGKLIGKAAEEENEEQEIEQENEVEDTKKEDLTSNGDSDDGEPVDTYEMEI